MSRNSEHLRDNVLDEHPLVQFNPVGKNSIVDVLRHKVALSKRHADKKPGIAKIAFEGHPLAVHLKADIRLICAMAEIDGHCALKPFERRIVATHPALLVYLGKHEFLLVLRQLSGN